MRISSYKEKSREKSMLSNTVQRQQSTNFRKYSQYLFNKSEAVMCVYRIYPIMLSHVRTLYRCVLLITIIMPSHIKYLYTHMYCIYLCV